MRTSIARFVAVIGFVTTLGAVRPAHAVTGYINGWWGLWNQNGNYCPSTNTCTGAWYPQSVFNAPVPISNAAIWIVDSSDAIIGTGATDEYGDYEVSWTRSTFPTQIGVVIFPYQKDGRFYFANTAGQLINNWFGLVNTASSSSPSSPQHMGSWTIGSSGAADPYYNAYWAAEWQWTYTMSAVGVLQSNFTNVEIRGFANTITGFRGTCNTSCANGSAKQVQLDANAGFSPQGRVMHELGHIAEYVTHPWQVTTDYTWGGGDNTWCQTCPEYGDAAFEEAFATHYGSITMWADDSVQPTTCLSSSTCFDFSGAPTSGTDLEASSYAYTTNNCSVVSTNPEARWPLSVMRYLWDVFDNHNDADGDTYSAGETDFSNHLYNLAWYQEGTDTDQINEPWNSAFTAVTEPDGRGAISYADNYAVHVRNTSVLRLDNCSPN